MSPSFTEKNREFQAQGKFPRFTLQQKFILFRVLLLISGHPMLCKNLLESLDSVILGCLSVILGCLSAQPPPSWVNPRSARAKALITLIKEKKKILQLPLPPPKIGIIITWRAKISHFSLQQFIQQQQFQSGIQVETPPAQKSHCRALSLHFPAPQTAPECGNIIYKVIFLQLSFEESRNL